MRNTTLAGFSTVLAMSLV